MFIQTEKTLTKLIEPFHPDLVVGDLLYRSFIKYTKLSCRNTSHGCFKPYPLGYDVIYVGEEINFTGFL